MEKLFDLFYQCSGVSIDTRNINENNLYIALKGANFNGNKFAQQALDNGAKYAIVDEEEYANNKNIFLVEDGLRFLQELAAYHRGQFKIPVVGITGSNGKTTSKELLGAVLQQQFNVLITKGNFNNHIGVPLTLLQLNKEHDLAIVEMGANKPGDIKELCDIANPNFGVITNIGSAHLEGFGTKQGVIDTKTELYRHIEENKGIIFVNANDAILTENLPDGVSTMTYGNGEDANVKGDNLVLNPNVSFFLDFDGGIQINTQIIGKYNFYNMLCAATVGISFGMEIETIKKGLESYIPSNNRSQVELTEKDNTLILDAYNANPTSVSSALESFSEMEANGKNKFFVLGDMLELGADSNKEHLEIIRLTKELNLKGVFVGPIYKSINDKDIVCFESKTEARTYIEGLNLTATLLILKGSRGIGLETLKDLF